MSETLNKPKINKNTLIEQAVAKFGGQKSYYQKISKEQLEASLKSDVLTQEFIAKLVEQLSYSAKNNQKINGRRLVAENKAGMFEGHYQEELQRRTYIEQQYYKVLTQLKQLLDVQESEILKASRLAIKVIKKIVE